METTEQTNELARIVTENGLASESAQWLVNQFEPFVLKAAPLIESASGVNVTDATQVTEIKEARRIRLALRAVRVEAEKHRKEIKADVLKTSQCIDAAGRWVAAKIEPVEARLQDMETFAERAEAERKARLKASREALIAPYGTDTRFIDMANMPDDSFASLLNQAKSAHEARLAAEAKAEAARIEAEKARKAEEERIRIENEKLKAEAVAREAAAKKEREAMEAKAAKEREAARAKLEAERKAREAAEAKAAKERAEAQAKLEAERREREAMVAKEREAKAAEARRLAEIEAAKVAADQAPDKEKLKALAMALRSVPLPQMKSAKGKHAIESISGRITELADSIESAMDEIK